MEVLRYEDHKLIDKIPARNRKQANTIAEDWLKEVNRAIAIKGTYRGLNTVLDYRNTYQK